MRDQRWKASRISGFDEKIPKNYEGRLEGF
jgi:hypothetical protein